jgi:hypothetical protein
LVWAIFWASFSCLVERDFERTGELAARAIALEDEYGFGFWGMAAQASQGAALVIVDPGRAAALIGDALAKPLQAVLAWHPYYLCFMAEALLHLDRVTEARFALDRALVISASTGVTWWDAELYRIRAAVIRAEGGGSTTIREALARGVAIAEKQGSETFRRRAAADMDAT